MDEATLDFVPFVPSTSRLRTQSSQRCSLRFIHAHSRHTVYAAGFVVLPESPTYSHQQADRAFFVGPLLSTLSALSSSSSVVQVSTVSFPRLSYFHPISLLRNIHPKYSSRFFLVLSLSLLVLLLLGSSSMGSAHSRKRAGATPLARHGPCLAGYPQGPG